MSGITNWSEALANPCFWVNRYCEVDPAVATELFGVSFKECQSYYLNHLLGGEDDSEQADGELKRMEGSTLPILFPEHYTWTIHFTHEAFVHTGVPVANGRKPTPKERAPTVERELANEAQPILRG